MTIGLDSSKYTYTLDIPGVRGIDTYDDTVSISISATDKAGNPILTESVSQKRYLIVDNTAPKVLFAYKNTTNFLDQITNVKKWEFFYIHWELNLLASLGYGLDLKKCAATGTTENLFYISPKSGKAVCKEKGLEYDKKLLRFPKILRDLGKNYEFNRSDLLDGLKITGFFLKKCFIDSLQNSQTITIRQRLIDTLSNEEYK